MGRHFARLWPFRGSLAYATAISHQGRRCSMNIRMRGGRASVIRVSIIQSLAVFTSVLIIDLTFGFSQTNTGDTLPFPEISASWVWQPMGSRWGTFYLQTAARCSGVFICSHVSKLLCLLVFFLAGGMLAARYRLSIVQGAWTMTMPFLTGKPSELYSATDLRQDWG